MRVAGESRAAQRISSEYEFPIPEKIRGSVSTRFKVRFSVREGGGEPGGIRFQRLDSSTIFVGHGIGPAGTQMPALRFDPCSVRISVPSSKSMAASPTFLGTAVAGGFHCRRPAIIEVDHQEQVILQLEHYPLPHTAQPEHRLPDGVIRRVVGAEHRR